MKMDWSETEKYLYEMKRAYEQIGWTGCRFGLTLAINPLVDRYKSGERTEELYNEIWSIK
jgi:hypothetical protein